MKTSKKPKRSFETFASKAASKTLQKKKTKVVGGSSGEEVELVLSDGNETN